MGWGAKAQNRRNLRELTAVHSSNSISSSFALAQMGSLRVEQSAFSYAVLRDFLSSSMDSLIVKVNVGGQVAYAKATTDFSRPKSVFPRTDLNIENDNLFNALWEAKLKPLSSADK